MQGEALQGDNFSSFSLFSFPQKYARLKLMSKKHFFYLLIFNFALLPFGSSLTKPAHADDIVTKYQIADHEAKDGDLLSMTDKGLVRSSKAYDARMFGILKEKPLAVFNQAGAEGQPVARAGQAKVNVINTGDVINPGDYLTSSDKPGKAQKAESSGYVLGIALEKSTQAEGQILAAVKIEYAELTTVRSANRFFEYFGAALSKNVKDPEKFGQVVRYILSGLVLLASFTFGFVTFSRSLPKSIEAIGRNPLAKNTIQFSLIVNVVLIVIVGILGLAAAVVIMRF